MSYFRRFSVTRPPSFGVWAIPRKCDFSSAAASVWIRKFRSTVRSTISISAIAKSEPMHRRAPPPNASHAGAAGLVPLEAMGIESFGVREDFRILVQVGNAHEHRAITRDPPLAEVEVRRPDPAANHIDYRARPAATPKLWPDGSRSPPHRPLGPVRPARLGGAATAQRPSPALTPCFRGPHR